LNFYFNHIITYLLIFKTVTYIFSEKPPKEYYSFTLDLATPEDLDFKCMLDYPKKKIYCFRSFSDEVDYIEQDILIQFPYPFPSLDDIEWDYDTFLSKVYRRVWNTKADCGNENIYNITDPNYKKWGLEGVLSRLSNNQCQVSSISKEDKHKFSFDMIVSFNSGEIVEKLNNKNNNDQIELLQEIWVPLLPPEEKKVKTKTYEREFPFAYCSTSDKINNKNYKNVKLNCYIPIELNTIFNGVIRINSFFDKLYIRQGKLVGDKLLEFLGVEEAFYVEGQINDIIETNKYQQKQLDEHLLSINYLKEENIALKRRVSSCESDVSDLRSENNRLKNRVSGLEDDVSTLYSRVRSLESSVSCL